MKVSVSWIQNYLSRTMSPEQVADALAMAGVEIEQIMSPTVLDKMIIIGQVKKVVQHPNADRLRIATVDVGADSTLEIVCGALNLAEGQKVAVSQIGAALPGGMVITKAELRGVVSNGMLCSVRELGLGDSHEGIWELPDTAVIGTPVSSLLPSGASLDIKTAANRYDLLSMYGLAAEVAAHAGVPLKPPEFAELNATGESVPQAVVQSGEHVGRFMVSHIMIKPGAKTPDWVMKLLDENGQRSLGLSVDVTNFVLHELAQPMHAYDAQKVQLPIIVRHAKDSESLVTLDGKTRKLTKYDLVIADATGPIGLAGVMGGLSTAVTSETTEILLEAAAFDAATVRKTAVRHGLRTDASARFERSLPMQSPEQGMRRALHILQEACGAELMAPVTDIVSREPTVVRVVVSASRISQFIAIELDQKAIIHLLAKQSMVAEATGVDEVAVDVPWWRPDIEVEEDVAEELVKLVGYDHVPARLPAWRPETVSFDAATPQIWKLKAELKATGLFEVATYSFISPTDLERLGENPDSYLKLKNPLSSEQTYLRRSLLASLLQTVARNQAYDKQFGVFELSRVFLPKPETGKQPDEPMLVAVAIRSERDAYLGVKGVLDRLAGELGLEFDLKAAQSRHFHPVRYATVSVANVIIGSIGEVHPDITTSYKLDGSLGYLELDVHKLLANVGNKQFRTLSKYPAVHRDVSLVVDRDVSWQMLRAEIRAMNVGEPAFLSDFYGDQLGGRKSIAFALELTDPEKTLTDAEAASQMKRLTDHLVRTFKAELRS